MSEPEPLTFTINVKVLDNFATGVPDILVNGEKLVLPIDMATGEIFGPGDDL
jgi:hypothetical protein